MKKTKRAVAQLTGDFFRTSVSAAAVAVIISIVLTWLVQFNVINTSNRLVYQIGDFLYRITDPALRPIRRVIPSVGGIDLSPLIVILILGFLQQFIPGLLLR